jgi:Pyruvate/2-oxoacid:ferredoxin oxidoreductase gamma subunit
VCAAAGAGYVAAASAYDSALPVRIREALEYKGFSVLEIQGVCPGRYTKKNKLTPGMIEETLRNKGYENGPVPENRRPEYGEVYRSEAASRKAAERPLAVEAVFSPPFEGLRTVSILGSAGQRIITAGELLGLAGMTAGLRVTQKNEYNITVLRGPSIADLILSPGPVEYTGTETPNVVLALADEGVLKRKDIFGRLAPGALAIRAADVNIPETRARVVEIDFKARKIKEVDRALTGLAALAGMNEALTLEMLIEALRLRFRGGLLETAEKQVREAAGFAQ